MRSLSIISVISAIIWASSSLSSLADCNPSEYFTQSTGNLTDIQKLASLDTMTEEAWERQKETAGGGVTLGSLSLSGSHREMQETVNKLKRLSKIDNYQSFRKSWVESSLDAEGLDAYKSCLNQSDGLNIVSTSLDSKYIEYSISWRSAVSAVRPEIIFDENLSERSLSALKSSLHDSEGANFFDFVNPLERVRENEPSLITVKLGNKSRTTYFPSLDIDIKLPEKTRCIERRILSVLDTYYTSNQSLSIGGSGAIGSDRAFIDINADCDLTLEFSAGARNSNQKFPNNNHAPAMFVRLIDRSGKIIEERNIGPAVIIGACGGASHFELPLSMEKTDNLNNINAFDVRLSNSKPVPC